jgi:D-xylose transport system permease protein
VSTTTTTTTAGGVKVVKPTVQTHLRDYFGRVRGGDLGSLPAVLGLVLLCIIFAFTTDTFTSTRNIANLFNQGASGVFIAMGLIFVLLLGEIDLSAGYASGVAGAVMAVLLTNHGMQWYVAIPAALVTGLVIGYLLGFLVAKVGIPSFVVTLAGFLGFQGVLLLLVKGGTNITIRDKFTLALNNNNLSVTWSWVLAAVLILGFAGVQLNNARTRLSRGLIADPWGIIAMRIVAMAVGTIIFTVLLTQQRAINPVLNSLKGVPLIVPIIAFFYVVWTFILGRTTFGRHIYAVGGNTEAARRAGIPVDRIRIGVFVLCSFMAAIGGIAQVSRGASVDPNTGGSSVLLYAVAAAVIGGTSLFGGKGKIIHAVVGGFVIAVINNGMVLLDVSDGVRYVITGVILLIAASVDALSRRRAAATGNR